MDFTTRLPTYGSITVTKVDFAADQGMPFNAAGPFLLRLDEARGQVAALRPGGTLLVTSATTGEGIAGWCALVEERLARKRAAAR